MTGNGFPDDLDFEQTIQIPRFGPTQKVFRRYTLQKILGRGGMGVVWLARDDQLETLVALKVLPEALCHDHASLQALKHETKLGLRLAHPNIVRIYDFQQDDNAAAISMEYVDGVTLSDVRVARPEKVISPSDLQPYIAALCDALSYAHTRRKIVHRDLKPRNLMLNSEGELKIADFGISRSISESMIMVTGKLGSTGSPPYISPQQWDGDQPSPLDDIYSVGATLYELLTSKPPLLGQVDWQQVHSNVPPPMWKRRSDLGITGVAAISPEWEETIAACLAKDPKDRPQTMTELQARLANHQSSNEADEEISTDALYDDTIVIPKAPARRQLGVPAEPLIDPKLIIPAPPLHDLKAPTAPEPQIPAAPLIDEKLTTPAPLSEPKEEPKTPSAPVPEVPAAPVIDQKLTMPSPLTEPQAEQPPTEVAPNEIEERSLQAKIESDLTPSVTNKVLEIPTPESRAIDAPLPPKELATPREEAFPQSSKQAVLAPELSYPSHRRMPRWIWAAAAVSIFVLGAVFLVWRKQSPSPLTSSGIESPHVASTPSVTGFTFDVDSVGKSPDGKQVFPKHVRAFINSTAVNLKGNENHWSADFGDKMPALPFDLEVSAPGYQPAVLHFEHVDDLKNLSPLRLDREQGNVVFRPNGTSNLTVAQLRMVEALPGQSEDIVVDSSTVVHDLGKTTPATLPTGVYEIAFQSANREVTTPAMRVAIQPGAVQPINVPKPPAAIAVKSTTPLTNPPVGVTITTETPPQVNKSPAPVITTRETPAPPVISSPTVPKTSPAVAVKGTPHLTNPPVSSRTTNETAPVANNSPAPVTVASETPAPPPLIPSPTVAIAKETPAPAIIPPVPSIAPEESPSSVNMPAAPAYIVKESPVPEKPSPPATETPSARTNERTTKSTERKPKKVTEPTRSKVVGRSPAAVAKPSGTPTRKKSAQPFEGGVPGG